MEDKIENSPETDKLEAASKEKRSLDAWLEIIISPLTWMVSLTAVGLFSGIRLEGNGFVILFCAFCTVGAALCEFFKVNMAYLIVPLILVFPKLLAQGGKINIWLIGIVVLYCYLAYLLISVFLRKKLSEKFPKENALYVSAVLPVVYFLLFQVYTLIRFKEIISGMSLVGAILLIFEIGFISMYWELLSKEKFRVFIEKVPKQYRLILAVIVAVIIYFLFF